MLVLLKVLFLFFLSAHLNLGFTHQSIGSLTVTTHGFKLVDVKIGKKEHELKEIEKHIVNLNGQAALPFDQYVRLESLKFSEPLSSTVAGIEFQIFIDPDHPPDGAVSLGYDPGLGKHRLFRRQSFQSTPRGQWTTWILWLPFPGKKAGSKVYTPWHIPKKFKGSHRKARSYGKVYLHRVRRLLPAMEEQNFVQQARAKHPSLFRQTWSQALFLSVLLLVIISILTQASRRVAFLFLGGFLIPSLFGLGFLLYGGFSTLKSLEQARIYEAESVLSRQYFRITRLQDRVEQRFQAELSKVIEKIQNYLLEGRRKGSQFEKNLTDSTHSKTKDPFEVFLNGLADEHGLEVLVTNGDTSFFSTRDQTEIIKANYARVIRKLLFESFKPGRKTDFREVLRKSQEAVLELRRVFIPNLVGGGYVDDFFNNPARIYQLGIKSTPLPWIDARDFWSFFTEPESEIPWLMLGSLQSNTLSSYLEEEYRKSGFLNQLAELPEAHLEFFLSGFHGDRSFPLKNENQGLFDLLSQQTRTQQRVLFQHHFENERFYIYLSGPLEKQPKLSLTLRLDATFLIEGLQRTENSVYLGTFFILGVLLCISFPLSRAVTNPILAISEGLNKVRSGDLRRDLDISGKDQFSLAASLFNEMIQGLREKEKISRFLSQMVLRSLQSGERKATRQRVTILFCGIWNLDDFIKDCELSSQLDWVNQFLQLFEYHLKTSGGSMDKFTGQAALALFSDEESQQKVLPAALKLREDLQELNEELVEEGLPSLEIGMGIATGDVVLGPVGSSRRKDYTAIGATVNMAARLHYQAKGCHRITIHLDQPTFERFQSLNLARFQKLSEVEIKGYAKKQIIYEVL